MYFDTLKLNVLENAIKFCHRSDNFGKSEIPIITKLSLMASYSNLCKMGYASFRCYGYSDLRKTYLIWSFHAMAMRCYSMPCHALFYSAVLCFALLCYAMLCYVMLCYAMSCYVMLCYAMLCYVMLCYFLLRNSRLRHATWHYTTLYYAKLCGFFATPCYACYANCVRFCYAMLSTAVMC